MLKAVMRMGEIRKSLPHHQQVLVDSHDDVGRRGYLQYTATTCFPSSIPYAAGASDTRVSLVCYGQYLQHHARSAERHCIKSGYFTSQALVNHVVLVNEMN